MKHTSVLLHETVDMLKVRPDGIYVDGTLGRGGHAKLLVSQLTTGHLYAFDQDEQAIEESKQNLADYAGRITFIHANFRSMESILKGQGISRVNGIMMDLGVSSPQFDDPARGFSYRFDARLDMRMDQRQEKDAEMVVNTSSEDELFRILHEYGEERYARFIARAIVKARQEKPIETTLELCDVIRSALPSQALHQKGHPAKKTFQALRIEVNDELNALQKGLQDALELLAVRGRCAVITFHSLEDRMVKRTFHAYASTPDTDPRLPIKAAEIEQPSYKLINRHPIVADDEEIDENHRAHSAKLRGIERTKE